MPSNYNIVKKILNSFTNLYVDEHNVMYSIPNCRVHELRGSVVVSYISERESDLLMQALAFLAREESVLGKLSTHLPFYCTFTQNLLTFNTHETKKQLTVSLRYSLL